MLIFPKQGSQKEPERFQTASLTCIYSSDHYVTVSASDNISYSAETVISQEPDIVPLKFTKEIRIKKKNLRIYQADKWVFALYFRPPPVVL